MASIARVARFACIARIVHEAPPQPRITEVVA
ncbi:hypothetical protein ACUXQ2_001408 [Cupriavidus metallidurans]